MPYPAEDAFVLAACWQTNYSGTQKFDSRMRSSLRGCFLIITEIYCVVYVSNKRGREGPDRVVGLATFAVAH